MKATNNVKNNYPKLSKEEADEILFNRKTKKLVVDPELSSIARWQRNENPVILKLSRIIKEGARTRSRRMTSFCLNVKTSKNYL
jgi:hypothetical protein